MLLKKQDIKKYDKIGNKALNLKILDDSGFLVPNFIVISPVFIVDIFNNPKKLDLLLDEIKVNFKQKKYIVRSSALVEDLSGSSMAGQFQSIIDLDYVGLKRAILSTIEHAKNILNGDLSKFALIIQEYIEPDSSGIVFTRNPLGGRELIIEHHNGIGDDIVSGKVNGIKKSFYHNQKEKYLASNLLKDSIRIEKIFQFPMDIEWCIKDNTLYFLQARKITTISEKNYKKIKTLESIIFDKKSFFYEKNELSEVSSRPSLFTFILLKSLYSINGPINNFYKKNKVIVSDKNFLKIIGNELYVDRELELKSSLPVGSYFRNKDFKASLFGFKGGVRSILNFIFLLFIKSNKNILEKNITSSFNYSGINDTFKQSLDAFYKGYSYIYEINFFASKSFKKLEILLKKENVSFLEVLKIKKSFILDSKLPDFKIDTLDFVGNSIDISDNTIFKGNFSKIENRKANAWWKELSQLKKGYFKKIIGDVIYYDYMREIGRCLTVKYISIIRNKILNIGISNFKNNPKLIYFCSIDEILEKKISYENVKKRKLEYEKFNKYTFPSKITSNFVQEDNNKPLGLSSGIASGVLVDIGGIKNTTGDKILYVDMLTPNLTSYFGQINGIISKKGAILSHLAIMAREYGLPVISNINILDFNIKNGNHIYINGDTGEVNTKDT